MHTTRLWHAFGVLGCVCQPVASLKAFHHLSRAPDTCLSVHQPVRVRACMCICRCMWIVSTSVVAVVCVRAHARINACDCSIPSARVPHSGQQMFAVGPVAFFTLLRLCVCVRACAQACLIHWTAMCFNITPARRCAFVSRFQPSGRGLVGQRSEFPTPSTSVFRLCLPLGCACGGSSHIPTCSLCLVTRRDGGCCGVFLF